jgi:sec-independent protein translocase protein TatA
MGELSPWHWIIVLLLAAVLFGSKRLPDAARGIGKSLRIFKAEMQSARDEEATAAPAAAPAAGFATGFAQPTPAAPVEDAVPADRIPEQATTAPVTAEPVAPPAPVTATAFATAEPVKPTPVDR